LVVGFDAEWNVTISDAGQHEHGEIAIVQIAYEKRVYILQVGVLNYFDLIKCHLLTLIKD
jgi:hypothetical protein